MDPVLLAGLVIGGITLLVVVTHITGGSVRASLASPDDARQAFAVDHPDADIRRVQLGDDGQSALLQLADGSLGAVFALGDRLVARLLPRSAIRRVRTREDRLVVALTDPGTPSLVLTLHDAAQRDAWRRRLEP